MTATEIFGTVMSMYKISDDQLSLVTAQLRSRDQAFFGIPSEIESSSVSSIFDLFSNLVFVFILIFVYKLFFILMELTTTVGMVGVKARVQATDAG